jgi:SHS2 domain-containing protein
LLPHTTDAYIEAVGSTFEQALENAGASLFDTMCELKSVSPKIVEEIQVEGANELALLYEWLEALLLKFELEHKAYSEFKVKLLKIPEGGFRISATVRGEHYDRGKHGAKVEVKAVTYHRMEVVREAKTTSIRFILDL